MGGDYLNAIIGHMTSCLAVAPCGENWRPQPPANQMRQTTMVVRAGLVTPGHSYPLFRYP